MNCPLGSRFELCSTYPVSLLKLCETCTFSPHRCGYDRLYELWFLFADKPLRFSLREFGDITGLKCEPEREKVGNGSESIDATPGRMWKELFETEDEDVTVPDVLRMLEQPSLPEWKRLPLALIALVDGLLQSTACYGFPSGCNFLLLKLSPHCLRKFPNLIKPLLSCKNQKDATQQMHF
uniref:DUF1985 domain-containing protein n=1 Tax=Brassica oleracea TaxID=3712 RepID=A0A3P6DQQ4_BRAOL|nr:unnamed protein product [Brassica oleracea]